MIWLLAVRNIIRNKKNSLAVIALIASITFLFFTGNSLLVRSGEGLRQAYVESLTGDIVIQKKGDVSMNLFGANTPIIDSFFTVPVLPAYDRVFELAAAEPGVRAVTSQVSGSAIADISGVREPAPLCGVDPATYFSLFEGIILDEGGFLKPGEFGVMITAERAERIEKQRGERPAIGAPVLLSAGSAAGFKIREAPLAGIYHYQNPGQFMSEVVLADPQTVRVLNSIQVASDAPAAVSGVGEGLTGLLDRDLLSLFNAGDDDAGQSVEEAFSVGSLEGFLGSFTREEEPEPLVGGDWHFIILRLEQGASAAAVMTSLNKQLEPWGAAAVGWRTAAGQSAILILLIQSLFNAGIGIVSVAGIIAAVNILLISVFKRTREIGTLRAIGAGDALIRRLIMGENSILALAAGGIGVLGGYAAVRICNAVSFAIPNTLVASLLGGEILRLSFLPDVAAASFLVALFLGVAASVYPVETAVRIEPAAAVRRG